MWLQAHSEGAKALFGSAKQGPLCIPNQLCAPLHISSGSPEMRAYVLQLLSQLRFDM
jgi:hypothetical protein